MLRKAWTLISMIFLLFVMTLKHGGASSSSRLRNMAVLVGSKAKISCSSKATGKFHWYLVKDLDAVDLIKINDGGNITSLEFSNFVAAGQLPGQTLETNSIRSENAGLIQCKATGNEYEAQLIVLDSEPTCNMTIVPKDKPTRAELYCSVGYSGFWSPTMEWIRTIDRSKMNGHLNITANKVTLTMQIDANNSDFYAQFSCRTFFSNETRPSSGASNIPDYNSSCTPTNNMGSTSVASDGVPKGKSDYAIWITTGFAGVACLIVLAVIIVFIRRNFEVCRKSLEPDLVQHADAVRNAEENVDLRNRAADQPAVAPIAEPEQPEGIFHENRVYAEVIILDRELPSYMHESPAWSGNATGNNDFCGRGMQPSPAFSQQSRAGTPNHATPRIGTPRTGTPRNGSPFQTVNSEDIKYLDINSVASIPVPQSQHPRRPPARLPTFQAVSYASIDHTARPPPPLPPSDD